MRTLSLFAAVLVCSISITQQVAAQSPLEISPDPTSANDLITLTIDVGQSSQHGLKTILQSNPDLPVYIWTWSPSDPIAGLGSWDNSNEDMKMTHEGGLKYSIQFTPSEWYQDVTNFYTNGISCLAKLKNGVDPMFEDIGEAKTEDFNIVPNAPVCDDLICVFPEGWRSTNSLLSVSFHSMTRTAPSSWLIRQRGLKLSKCSNTTGLPSYRSLQEQRMGNSIPRQRTLNPH